jgi:hypothetical protein
VAGAASLRSVPLMKEESIEECGVEQARLVKGQEIKIALVR